MLGAVDPSKLYGRDTAFNLPPHYHSVVNRVRSMFSQSDLLEIQTQYLLHYRQHSLDQVMLIMELNNLCDVLEHHSATMASFAQCRQLLENYTKLVLLEEIQMKMDIAQYDLHFVKLEGKYLNHVPGLGMIVKIKIQGSNESRPKICIGDGIRLRPVPEDIPKIPPAWRYSFGEFFELRGICMDYTLASEEAIFDFPRLPGTVAEHSVDGLELFNALRFHARFTFDKCGPAFIRQSMNSISHNPYLLESFFPTEDTMGRLINYFRCHSTNAHIGSRQASSPVSNFRSFQGEQQVRQKQQGGPLEDQHGAAVDNLVSVVPYILSAYPADSDAQRDNGSVLCSAFQSLSRPSGVDGSTMPPSADAIKKGQGKAVLSKRAAKKAKQAAAAAAAAKTSGSAIESQPSNANNLVVTDNNRTGGAGGGGGGNAHFNNQQLKAISLITALASNERRVQLLPGDNPHFAG